MGLNSGFKGLNITDVVNLVFKGLANALDDIVMFNHTPLSCLLFKDVFSVAKARPIHRGMQKYYEGWHNKSKQAITAHFIAHIYILMIGLEDQENLRKNNWFSGRDSRLAPTEYEVHELKTRHDTGWNHRFQTSGKHSYKKNRRLIPDILNSLKPELNPSAICWHY